MRKAFTDQFDHLGDQDPFLVNPHDQDWYYYNGVSLSYTFYKIRCPDSYKNNKRTAEVAASEVAPTGRSSASVFA